MKTGKLLSISIIIVNYNNFQLLQNCLQSIINFTKDLDYEIIIVDNNSTEGNIEEAVHGFPIKLIQNKTNIGFAAANNIGAGKAKGEYILFLNNDTLFIENSLYKIMTFIKDTNFDGIVGCKLLNEDMSLQISIADFDNLCNLFGENFFLYKVFPQNKILNKYHQNFAEIYIPTETDIVKGAFIFMSKSDFVQLNGFDESFFFYAEETDLCYRYKRVGGKIIYYPGTAIIHLEGKSANKDLSFRFRNQAIGKIRYFRKHFTGAKFLVVLLMHYSGLILRSIAYFILGILFGNKKLLGKAKYFLLQIFAYPRN